MNFIITRISNLKIQAEDAFNLAQHKRKNKNGDYIIVKDMKFYRNSDCCLIAKSLSIFFGISEKVKQIIETIKEVYTDYPMSSINTLMDELRILVNYMLSFSIQMSRKVSFEINCSDSIRKLLLKKLDYLYNDGQYYIMAMQDFYD